MKSIELDAETKKELLKILRYVREAKRRNWFYGVAGAVRDFMRANYEELGCGASRTTFKISENWILKVARDERAYHNITEAEMYRANPENKAPCRIVKGCPHLLLMRRVEDMYGNGEFFRQRDELCAKHPWLSSLMDGQQVGYIPGTDELVCYDYAGCGGNGEHI